jgi:hypothetical protein
MTAMIDGGVQEDKLPDGSVMCDRGLLKVGWARCYILVGPAFLAIFIQPEVRRKWRVTSPLREPSKLIARWTCQ